MAKIIRDFFWEGSRDDGGMHDVNGETTASEIDGEGLALETFNIGILPYWKKDMGFLHEENMT